MVQHTRLLSDGIRVRISPGPLLRIGLGRRRSGGPAEPYKHGALGPIPRSPTVTNAGIEAERQLQSPQRHVVGSTPTSPTGRRREAGDWRPEVRELSTARSPPVYSLIFDNSISQKLRPWCSGCTLLCQGGGAGPIPAGRLMTARGEAWPALVETRRDAWDVETAGPNPAAQTSIAEGQLLVVARVC
jgi:hypothetical protein